MKAGDRVGVLVMTGSGTSLVPAIVTSVDTHYVRVVYADGEQVLRSKVLRQYAEPYIDPTPLAGAWVKLEQYLSEEESK